MTVDFLLPVPQSQALSPEAAFKVPPLDGSLNVAEIYDWHLLNNPDHAVFIYAQDDGELIHVRYSQVIPAAHRAARHVACTMQLDINHIPLSGPPVVIIAATDTITYFCTVVGMMRAGIPIFPISPRNSPAAIAHLLNKTGATQVLISVEPTLRELVQASVKALRSDSSELEIQIYNMPIYEDIFAAIPADAFKPLPPLKYDWDTPIMYVHSSGSSSFPKPISWNHKSFIQLAAAPHFGAFDLCGEVFGCHALTMSHAVGLNHRAWMSGTGLIMSTFKPASPAQIPTPDAVFEGFVKCKPAFAICVPSFAEAWSHDPSKVEYFKSIKALVYGGGPLNKLVGDFLVSQGVNIFTLYGATETGVMCKMFPEPQGKDWEYFPMNPHFPTKFVPAGNGLYELVIIKRPISDLTVINTEYQGEVGYATGDLFFPHPTKSGYWKIYGRVDEQIMLSTGEKTNPVPLEAILMQHPKVQGAVMFGRGRFQNGVIIEPKKEFMFDPNDERKLLEFRNSIWSKVEEMNAFAPAHSRLFKEMIIVTSPEKPFFRTGKGTIRRNAALEDYKFEIETVYVKVEESAQSDLAPPVDWSFESSLQFIRKAVTSVVKNVGETDDIFERGCDSLQATWIRNTILHALRSTPGIPAQNVPADFVYQYPTITSLAQFASTLAHTQQGGSNDVSHAARHMDALIAKYATKFGQHTPTVSNPDKDVVLLTGSTGSLGSVVLARLVASDSVVRVFAFNRKSKSGGPLLMRQKAALAERGFDPEIATSSKVVFVEGTLNESGLGIPSDLQDEIRATITHIFHIAWQVDFNLSLRSYESSLGGVRSLIDLALSSPHLDPPRLIFTSSIGVFRNLKTSGPVAERPLEDLTIAAGQGYAESKCVAERILELSAQSTPLRPVIVRVGQICGGINGSWNVSDWVPAIVKSSMALGYLPDIDGVVSWIPLDVTASSLVDMRNADVMTLHLVHPKPVSCRQIFAQIASELRLCIRPYSEWVEALEELVADHSKDQVALARDVPALKLLSFYRRAETSKESQLSGAGHDAQESMGLPLLQIDGAMKTSVTLRSAASLEIMDVKQWLRYWRQVGFIP